MIEEQRIRSLRQRLEAELSALNAEEIGSKEDRGTVVLDQQSVGRLSRMDALQRQAMATAQNRRRHGRKAQINAAIARMDSGEFGACLDCGDEIEAKRLALDPCVLKCRDCMTG